MIKHLSDLSTAAGFATYPQNKRCGAPDDEGIRILGRSQDASAQPCKAPARDNGRSKFGFAGYSPRESFFVTSKRLN